MWGDDERASARGEQAMEFLHHLHNIGNVFNDVDRPYFAERIVRKGIGKPVQIRDNIRPSIYIPIQPNCAGIFVNPAANVQDRQTLQVQFLPFEPNPLHDGLETAQVVIEKVVAGLHPVEVLGLWK